MTLPEMVERLAELTEQHVAAAVALDAATVAAMARRRVDLLFELDIALQSKPTLTDAQRRETKQQTERLARAEQRLAHVIGHVLTVLTPTVPSVYGRTGRLGWR
ncbi:MAG: hypothetical protein AAGA48_23990 [Myxococcota bacterium]